MRILLLLAASLTLISCAKAPETKDAIRQAVVDYYSKRDDMIATSMDIEVLNVQFRGKEAEATVAVGPKGSGGAGGIRLNYTLDAEGTKWVVRKKPASATPGTTPGMAPGANPHGETPANPHGEGGTIPLPAAPGTHPSTQPGSQALPPGHPPVQK